MNLRRNLSLFGLCGILFLSNCKKENSVEPVVNNKPKLERVTANPQKMFPGKTSTLECVVEDDDDSYLSYSWDKDGGYFESNNGKKVVWRAPNEVGEYHITVGVEDIEENWSDSENKTLTVVSQYDTIYVSEDAYVDQLRPDFNSQGGDSWFLFLGESQGGFKSIYQKFLMDDNIANRTIKSVNLELRIVGGSNEYRNPNCYIYSIMQEWDQYGINYNYQPDLNPIAEGYFELPPQEVRSYAIFDITNIAKKWISDPAKNYGICIKPSPNMDGVYSFISKEGEENYGQKTSSRLTIEFEE